MAGVPYVFGNATTSIPLTNLDANFNTGLTIGNTTVGLGNTVTTLGNVTLNNANFGGVANAVIYTNSVGNVTSNASVFSVNGTNIGIGYIPSGTVEKLSVSTSSGSGLGFNTNSTYTNWVAAKIAPIDFGLNYTGGLAFYTNPGPTAATAPTEVMRIDSSGNFLVGSTSASNHRICNATAQGSIILQSFSTTTGNVGFVNYAVSNEAYNAAATSVSIGKNSSTSRSINAGGTVNVSGLDYAEYMTKARDFILAKGDICGIDVNGKLTNIFSESISFVVKSTNPSYVGGDTWGNEEALGLKNPVKPIQILEVKDELENITTEAETDEEFNVRISKYESDKKVFDDVLEAQRQMVDRIAFSGQVPVNVLGATAGQYIIPVNNNGAIFGQAVNESDMTLQQYMQAVGKVISVKDNVTTIIVKVA
jgi:hypothetical protein